MEKIPFADIKVPQAYDLIGNKVAPVIPVGTPAGTFYFSDIVATSAAQTNRSAGTAPTAQVIAEGSVAFTTAELIDRVNAPKEKIALWGGEDKAKFMAAQVGLRNVMVAHEKNVADALFGATTNAVLDATISGGDGAFLDLIETAKYRTQLCSGKKVLVCGSDAFRTILSISTVSTMLDNLSGVTPATRYLPQTLANLLGLDDVLVGNLGMWGASGTADYSKKAIVLALPYGDLSEVLTAPQAIRTLAFYPNGEEAEIGWYHSDDARSLIVDVCAQNVVKVLNGEGIQVIENLNVAS